MTHQIRLTLLIISFISVAAQASAEVVLLSQSRSVFGEVGSWAYGVFDADSLSAPDFDLFQGEISVETFDPMCGGTWGSSNQDSEIQTRHFSIHGNASADYIWACGDWPDYYYFYCTTRSNFEVRFDVLTATSFNLNGSLATGPYSGFASLQLDRNGEPYLSFYADGEDEIAVGEDGVLSPGTYALTVNAMAYAGDYIGVYDSSSSFDFDFIFETTVSVEEKSWDQVKAMFR